MLRQLLIYVADCDDPRLSLLLPSDRLGNNNNNNMSIL